MYMLHVFILFCSLRFVYIDFDGNEVLQKDAAAVTVDGTLLVCELHFLHVSINKVQ